MSRQFYPTIDIARAAQKAGWSYEEKLVLYDGVHSDELTVSVAVALGETDGEVNSHYVNESTHDDSWGPWQINTKGDLWPELQEKYGLTSKEQLWDLDLNARIAHSMYEDRGWQPWGAYTHPEPPAIPAYRRYGRFDKAQAAVTQLLEEEVMLTLFKTSDGKVWVALGGFKVQFVRAGTTTAHDVLVMQGFKYSAVLPATDEKAKTLAQLPTLKA